MDRIGHEIDDVDEKPVRLDSLDVAFDAFRPSVAFAASAGEGAQEVVAEVEFLKIEDFEPRNIFKGGTGKRNDVALLDEAIGQLSDFREWWLLPGVQRVWKNVELRDRMLRTPIDLLTQFMRSSPEKLGIENSGMEATHAKKLLEEALDALPPLLHKRKASLTDLFSPERGNAFIDQSCDIRSLVQVAEYHNQVLHNVGKRISEAEQLRDTLMARLYQQLRPLEASYRQLELFYENSFVPDGKRRPPVELFVLNADAAAMKDENSVTLEAVRRFVKSRNDNFTFRDDIWHLVVPGPISSAVREALEQEAWKWGMLLITDLGNERSSEDIERRLATGGRYEFLGRADGWAATDIVTVGYLKLRDDHWFEEDVDNGDGLYAPDSLVFAGALARTDRGRKTGTKNPPDRMFGRIKGVRKARVEFPISRLKQLSQQMQLVTVSRDDDGDLCFYGCECLGEEPHEVYKFFAPFRALSFLNRLILNYLKGFSGEVLTKYFILDEVDEPIKNLLDEQKKQGAITVYDFELDKDSEKRKRGICDIRIDVQLFDHQEIFRWRPDIPDSCFKAMEPGVHYSLT